jgi:hypothetical protein
LMKSQEGKRKSRSKVTGLARGTSKAETFEASKYSRSGKKSKSQEEEQQLSLDQLQRSGMDRQNYV